MSQPDLFAFAERGDRAQRAAEEIMTGRQLAEHGAQRALDGAQAQTDGAFAQAALRFLVNYAADAHPRAVTLPEVRMAARDRGGVPEVRDDRAWGRIPQDARRLGYLEPAGYLPSPDPTSHSRPCGAWRSTGRRI